jgi:RNA polymerase sigma-70 factor (ECF subfamily)
MGIEEIFRAEHGRILATLIRLLGDIDLAEEALQDAFAAALEQWPEAGTPANPTAWLVSTGRHKAIDRLRRSTLLVRKQEEIARHIELSADDEETPVPEDRLRLIFTCCHPALALEAQVALTLRTLGGLSTEEIARAFLVPAPTMAQRIVRAKAKIRVARIP